jgi:putative DNA primase/helicase
MASAGMNADRIGLALKGRRHGKGWLVSCPCPNHGNHRGDLNPSLSVTDGDDDRLLLKCFAGCEFEDVMDQLRRRGLTGAADGAPQGRKLKGFSGGKIAEPTNAVAIKPDPEALRIWNATEYPHGTAVEQYLQRRGIPLIPARVRAGHDGKMVVGVEAPHSGVIAIQTTPVDADGNRTGNRWTKGELGTGAVRLGAAQEIMGIAEGTETALSAMTLTGMSVWASLGAGRLHKVELPPFVRKVHIFADNDEPGRVAAEKAAKIHQALGRRVWIQWPPDGLKDFNDFLIQHADRWAEIDI